MTTITTDLQPRMQHPAMIVPDAMAALQAVGAAVGQGDVADSTIELVNMRASQINGCGVCLVGPRAGREEAGRDRRPHRRGGRLARRPVLHAGRARRRRRSPRR